MPSERILPEHIDWTAPGYWLLVVAVALLVVWLADTQGPKPRT